MGGGQDIAPGGHRGPQGTAAADTEVTLQRGQDADRDRGPHRREPDARLPPSEARPRRPAGRAGADGTRERRGIPEWGACRVARYDGGFWTFSGSGITCSTRARLWSPTMTPRSSLPRVGSSNLSLTSSARRG